MNNRSNRRAFLRQTALAAAGVGVSSSGAFAKPFFIKPSEAKEKINIGVIGVAGRGRSNLNGVKSENIVALCDVDARNLAKAAEEFPNAKRYSDYRELLGQKDLDAVVISTPDHTHAVITVAALEKGKHVYCEKPLTHTVSEAREVLKAARQASVATQMGNQIHSHPSGNYRRVVEEIQSGSIGAVQEVHVWAAATYEARPYPVDVPPVPEYLDYENWLGPVRYRPYHPEYVPFKWRNWWLFGGGTMADFGCHFMDLPHWALDLGTPIAIEQVAGPSPDPQGPPKQMIVQFDYAARGDLPPVRLTWYQGGQRPPYFDEGLIPDWKSGVLFVGEDKRMLAADYTRKVLLPEYKYTNHKAPKPFIPNSIGHHAEWIQACKTGGSTGSNFGYACELTESILLGNVAHRTGKLIEWDSKRLRAIGCPEADQFIHHHYRKGWSL